MSGREREREREREKAFRSICIRAEDKGLKINAQKTQLLSVSSDFYRTIQRP